MKIGKWVTTLPPAKSKTGKTKIWPIIGKHGFTVLGHVQWFARWRCYTFRPEPDTVFNSQCMRELATFCEDQTQQHKKGKPR